MTTGTKARIIPEAVEPADLRDALKAMEDLIVEVYVASTYGECAVRLPEGVTVPVFSCELPYEEGREGGRYINLPLECLECVEEVVLLVG
ncbi:MAG: hypothetical protein Q7K33_00165 [Candidatus Berkelbacteria bacterium]|nr:hypothetical protein [Candidatus Berkelbacteria bacterium]